MKRFYCLCLILVVFVVSEGRGQRYELLANKVDSENHNHQNNKFSLRYYSGDFHFFNITQLKLEDVTHWEIDKKEDAEYFFCNRNYYSDYLSQSGTDGLFTMPNSASEFSITFEYKCEWGYREDWVVGWGDWQKLGEHSGSFAFKIYSNKLSWKTVNPIPSTICNGKGLTFDLSQQHSESSKGLNFYVRKLGSEQWGTSIGNTLKIDDYSPGNYELLCASFHFTNGHYYSSIISFQVLPASPQATVSVSKSCVSSATAEITISNLQVDSSVEDVVLLLNTKQNNSNVLGNVTNVQNSTSAKNGLNIQDNVAYYRLFKNDYGTYTGVGAKMSAYFLTGTSTVVTSGIVRLSASATQNKNYYLYIANGGSNSGACFSNPIPITVSAHPLPVITIQSSITACYNVSNGGAVFSVAAYSGGTYSSVVSGEFSNPRLYSSGERTLFANYQGNYKISVTTTVCPTDEVSKNFVVNQHPRLPKINEIIQPSCSLPWNGKIMLLSESATANSFYIVRSRQGESPIVTTSFTSTELREGVYSFTVNVKNFPECNTTLSATLVNPPTVRLTATITLDDILNDYIKCFGDMGTVTVNTSVESYVWSLSSITQNSFQAGSADPYESNKYIVSQLPSDSYYFTARRKLPDNFVCYDMATVTFFVPQPSLVVPTSTTQSITCWGTFTGMITWTVEGGTPPYRYSWQGLNPLATYVARQNWTEPYADLLPQGLYTMTVKDANQCTHTRSTYMPQPNAVNVSLSEIAPIPCKDTDGTSVSITIRDTQGTFGFDIWRSYQASRTLYISEQSVTSTIWRYPLHAGNYEMVLYDSKQCPASVNFVAIEPSSSLSYTVSTFDVCEGQEYGSMEVLAQGSNGAPYYYAIHSPLHWQAANVNSSTERSRFEDLALKEDYELYLLDNGGCLTKTNFGIRRRTDPAPTFKIVTASVSNMADRVLFRDVCIPAPDSVRWEYPKSLILLRNNNNTDTTDESRGIWLGAEQEGTYGLKMYGYWGACNYNLTKSFTFNTAYNPYMEYANTLPTVQKITLYPNPSSGIFKIYIESDTDMPVFIEVLDLSLQTRWLKETNIENRTFDQEVDLSELDSGQYLMIVKTPFDLYSNFLVIAK